ncbi:hypothetical protein [Pelagicoccus sp. SDUM812002]|uniref:hypothetical protein n=1 Tax=Pelagicoccus sp. SDUM812002 TaxID=3041266 RepID=UPI00280DE555|nr:hypothetical protein [Pelagicoccus sp. SDUM812002]MDQ8186211.1 hypothetical protein [Pelagicoccus sp. SDUM812002]
MNALKRYTHRIIIPVAAAAFIAVTANLIYRSVTADETSANSTDDTADTDVAAATAPQPGQAEDETSEFTEQKLNNEISALTLTLENLGETVDDPPPENIEELKEEAETKVSALQEATPDNWIALRDDAYETVKNYATAVGRADLDQSK